MQIMGCDINPTSYSKLEGQIRGATDRELFAASKILDVKLEELFTPIEDNNSFFAVKKTVAKKCKMWYNDR